MSRVELSMTEHLGPRCIHAMIFPVIPDIPNSMYYIGTNYKKMAS